MKPIKTDRIYVDICDLRDVDEEDDADLGYWSPDWSPRFCTEFRLVKDERWDDED